MLLPHPRAVRAAAVSALAVALVPVLVACSSDAPVAITPPEPTGRAAAACERLAPRLPAEVDGASSSQTTPDSPYTAAWGDIVLACGGPAPDVEPTAQLLTIDEVAWYPEPLPQGGTRFSSVGREAVVSVSVPINHRPEADVLVDVSTPVREAIPALPEKD